MVNASATHRNRRLKSGAARLTEIDWTAADTLVTATGSSGCARALIDERTSRAQNDPFWTASVSAEFRPACAPNGGSGRVLLELPDHSVRRRLLTRPDANRRDRATRVARMPATCRAQQDLAGQAGRSRPAVSVAASFVVSAWRASPRSAEFGRAPRLARGLWCLSHGTVKTVDLVLRLSDVLADQRMDLLKLAVPMPPGAVQDPELGSKSV